MELTDEERWQLEAVFAALAGRFRGYDCASEAVSESILRLLDGDSMGLEFSADRTENFALFFHAQRHLAKAGPGVCASRSPLSLTAAFLFVQLYRETPPPEFADAERCHHWQQDYAARAENCAALVRRWLSS